MRMVYMSKRSLLSPVISYALFVTLIAGIFGIVGLGSKIMNLEYEIGSIEAAKTEALKERKAMEAERTSLLTINEVQKKGIVLDFPVDRERIVYVKRVETPMPMEASYSSRGVLPNLNE